MNRDRRRTRPPASVIMARACLAARRAAVWGLAALAAAGDRTPGTGILRRTRWETERRCLAAMWRFHRAAVRIDARELPELSVDRRGIPHVHGTEEEVWRALGFAAAWAQAFPMDLTRRMMSGHAAELLGDDWLDSDERQRRLGTEHYAMAIVEALPPEQRRLLDSYAEGVNLLLDSAVPWEYELVGGRPRPWRPVDSVLVVQNLFAQLTDPAVPDLIGRLNRLSPPDGGDALLARGLGTTVTVDGQVRPADPAALERLGQALRNAWREPARGNGGAAVPLPTSGLAAGSNSWAVSADRSADKAPILANDIHLPLSSPGPLMFVRCDISGVAVQGFVRPGIPVIVAGSTRRISWGLTRLCGRTSEWLRGSDAAPTVVRRVETVGSGASRRSVPVHLTRYGPVLTADGDVLRWTALEPGAVDFGLARLPWCEDTAAACDVAAAAGGPPMSFLVVDRKGGMGWTVTGRLLLARDDGRRSPLLTAAETPRVVDPPSGLLVTANHDLGVRLSGGAAVAVNPYPAARARRIVALLDGSRSWDPSGLARVQADVDASFYLPWRDVFLPYAGRYPAMEEALRAWDGTAHTDARGLYHVILLHLMARDEVFGALGGRTAAAGLAERSLPAALDDELLALVQRRDPGLVPPRHADWDAFLNWCVDVVKRYLEHRFGPRVHAMRWGQVNRARIRHPLSARVPRLSWAVDRPAAALPGCDQSVNVAAPSFGSAMRMVASPATGALIVSWPGGQSGDPLSGGYDALYTRWLQGEGIRLDWAVQPRRRRRVRRSAAGD